MKRYTLLLFALVWIAATSAAGFAADPITPSPHLPASTPWDLARLSEPPAFEWVDTEGPVHSLLYQGESYNGQPTQVFAYYATPATLDPGVKQDQNFPAVVLVHGGGGTAFREWAELWARRGYAAIAMDLAGYRPTEEGDPHQRENRQRLAQGGPDQGDDEKFGSIDKPAEDQWPYHAVANVIRAHSLLRSFAAIDRSRTAVTGISWGGYLTCIVAGVDSRFQAAVPVYGCGYLHENSVWLDRLTRMEPQQRQRWITLWDPSRYLAAVTMPILFVNGTNDFAYPLDSYMKSYDTVPGVKQIRVTVKMPHGHPAGWAPREIGWFIDHHLRGQTALPMLGDPVTEAGLVRMKWEGPVALSQATLHFTTDSGAINQRSWSDRPAAVEGSQVIVAAPPKHATAWFLSVTDERGAVISSRVVIP